MANMGVHRLALHLVVPLCFIFLIKVPRGTAFFDTNCLDIERNLGVRFYKMQFNADELCSNDCKSKGAYGGKLPDLLSQVNPTEREDYADLRPGQQDDPNPQPLVDSVEQIPQASDCVCCSNETGNGDCIEMSKREDCEFRNGNLICDTKCKELEGAISGFCDVLLDCWCCTKLNPEYDQTDMVQFEPTN